MSGTPPTPEQVKSNVTGVFSRSAYMYDSVIPFFGTFAAKLVDVADPKSGERVLDVACGRGACLFPAAERVGESGSVVGIDLADNMVTELQAAIEERGLANAHVRLMDAEDLDFPDGSFDVVTIGFSVFFFPHPEQAFSEMLRVMAPGARLVASTFGDKPSYPWMKDVAEAVGKGGQGPPKSPVATTAGLEKMLAEVGFADVTSTPIDSRFVFPDVDAFVDWNWSHGGRGLLEQLDGEGLATFRQEAEKHLRQHATEGGYELVQTANATTAQKR